LGQQYSEQKDTQPYLLKNSMVFSWLDKRRKYWAAGFAIQLAIARIRNCGPDLGLLKRA